MPHSLIWKAFDYFRVPVVVVNLVREYFQDIRLCLSTAGFTRGWQRLEIGIMAGCTISTLSFKMVMEIIIRAFKWVVGGERYQDDMSLTPIRADMDDMMLVTTTTTHCYADDRQVYISSEPTAAIPPTSLITCLDDIRSWMSRNFLKLNGNKTRPCSSAPNPSSPNPNTPQLHPSSSTLLPPSQEPRVILDSTISFVPHIQNINRTAFFHLRNISRLRSSLTRSSTEILVHSFVTSRIDYCNALLTELPTKLINTI